jgi:hypothetical protein
MRTTHELVAQGHIDAKVFLVSLSNCGAIKEGLRLRGTLGR